MTDATKVGTIIAAARGAERNVDAFALADVLAPDAAMAVTGNAVSCYVSGPEVVLHGTATRAASAALVAGTAITVGTLIAEARPHLATTFRAAAYLSSGLIGSAGFYSIGTDGVITFTPDGAQSAAAGMVFRLAGTRLLLASAFSDDVA